MRRLRSAAGPREVYTRLERPERRSTEVIIPELRRPETARMELRPERRRDLLRRKFRNDYNFSFVESDRKFNQQPIRNSSGTGMAAGNYQTGGPGYSSGSTGSTSGSSASTTAPGGSTGTSTVSPGGSNGTSSNNNYYTNTGSVTGPGSAGANYNYSSGSSSTSTPGSSGSSSSGNLSEYQTGGPK